MVKKTGLATIALLACFISTQAIAGVISGPKDTREVTFDVTVTPYVVVEVKGGTRTPVEIAEHVGLPHYRGAEMPVGKAPITVWANCNYTLQARASLGMTRETLFMNQILFPSFSMHWWGGTIKLDGMPAVDTGNTGYPLYAATIPGGPTPVEGRDVDLEVRMDSIERKIPVPGVYSATIQMFVSANP